MKRVVNYIVSFLTVASILVSCNSSPSLQSYFVDNQESASFISQDIPLSMLKIDTSSFTEKQKEAYSSVNRLNFLGYKADTTNIDAYNAELAKVKAILSDIKYKDLMEFSDRGYRIVLKYIGTDEDADEVIILGSSKMLGFGIVRVLGDDMNPNKMITLAGVLKSADISEAQLENVVSFFK